jgi:secreted Zn-dependent insulinase-like peptidase
MLVNGNYTKDDAKKLGRIVEKNVPIQKSIKKGELIKVVKLGQRSVQTHQFKDRAAENVAVWYLQNPVNNDEMLAKTLLLSKFIDGAFFSEMRVEKQLGYAVHAFPHIVEKTSGIGMMVQSPTTASDEIAKHMKTFVKEFNLELARLDDKKLATIKDALIHQMKEKPQNVDEQTELWWNYITRDQHDFDRNEKLANIVSTITTKDLISFSQDLLGEESQVGQLWVITPPKTKLANHQIIESITAFKEKANYFPSDVTG